MPTADLGEALSFFQFCFSLSQTLLRKFLIRNVGMRPDHSYSFALRVAHDAPVRKNPPYLLAGLDIAKFKSELLVLAPPNPLCFLSQACGVVRVKQAPPFLDGDIVSARRESVEVSHLRVPLSSFLDQVPVKHRCTRGMQCKRKLSL